MNKRDVTELGIKLLAVWVAISLVTRLPRMLATAMQVILRPSMVEQSFAQYVLLRVAFLLATGFEILVLIAAFIFLWRKARSLGGRFWSAASDETEEQIPATSEQVQRVAFATLGLYLIVTALPNLLQTSVELYQGLMDLLGPEHAERFAYLLGLIAQMLIGMWLVAGPERFQRTVDWLRGAGDDEDEEWDEDDEESADGDGAEPEGNEGKDGNDAGADASAAENDTKAQDGSTEA